jgi:thiol-disulfide isomerase/thioredoxin
MRKLILLVALSFFPFCIVLGQNAVLHVNIGNGKSIRDFLYVPSQPRSGSFIRVKDSSTAVYTFQLKGPEFVQLNCSDLNDWEHKHFNYLLYLSPGDDLELNADFDEPEFGLKMNGKGSNNNQPLMSAMESVDLHGFYKDSLPYRVINLINSAQKIRESNFEKYITMYNPSPSYVKDWKISLSYYACDLYYDFKEENRLYTFDAYYRNFGKWREIADSLFSVAKLNNETALGAFHFDQLQAWFLEREREHFADEAYLDPEVFYREWYSTDTVTGKKLFTADSHNLPREKIINRYFAGRQAEYLYAVLFNNAVNEGNPKNIPEIFARFKQKYPHSEYITQFSRSVDTIITRQKETLNERMVFMASDGAKLNSLDEVLAAMKGKTVLVDMWGTWCTPCREEIEKNSGAIREHFKDKGLTYLYIANYDMDRVEQWKKLIAYFDMEGTHLLANKKLTDDIMAKVKGQGFPTVFIIKKDGSFELSKTQNPMNRDILFKQMDEALAQ